MKATPLIHLLNGEFKRRNEKNPAYSLRAFAKTLKMSHSALSQILSGKRPVTTKTIMRVSDSLKLSPKETHSLLQGSTKEQLLSRLAAKGEEAFSPISQDQFQLIADWYHFAILELTRVQGFRSDIDWIAKKLKISKIVAQDAVSRLERLNLLGRDKKGRYIDLSPEFMSYGDTKHATAARQKLQKQLFDKAAAAIEEYEFGERYHSGVTMSVSKKRMPEAVEIIKKFRRDLCKLMNDDKNDDVYHLAIALFPLTDKDI